jgi:UDPglucose 6-dehydrogenase
VDAVAAEIGRALNGYKIVVNKSTVPVGTGDRVRRIIEQHRVEPHEFDVVSNPEFLREGSAVHDTLHPDRIVIGADNPRAAMRIVELYAPLERPMLITNLATAEIIKYASNTFLALKISYINAIADLCERTGADVVQVAKAMGYDQRIGHAFLQAGLGFGGSCFPKDVQAFAHTVQRYELDPTLFQTVLDINNSRAPRFVAQIQNRLGDLTGQGHRAAGAGVQAQHRRHSRGALAGDYPPAAAGWRDRQGIRPRRHAARAAHLPRSPLLPQRLRGRRER